MASVFSVFHFSFDIFMFPYSFLNMWGIFVTAFHFLCWFYHFCHFVSVLLIGYSHLGSYFPSSLNLSIFLPSNFWLKDRHCVFYIVGSVFYCVLWKKVNFLGHECKLLRISWILLKLALKLCLVSWVQSSLYFRAVLFPILMPFKDLTRWLKYYKMLIL